MRVLLVGGRGGFESLYRSTALSLGHELLYVERGTLPIKSQQAQLGAVLVSVSLCSHALRGEAQALAVRQRAKYVALQGYSVSAVRRALEGLVRP